MTLKNENLSTWKFQVKSPVSAEDGQKNNYEACAFQTMNTWLCFTCFGHPETNNGNNRNKRGWKHGRADT